MAAAVAVYGIPVGVPTTILQNQVVGLPSRLSFIQSTVAIDGSVDGVTWVAMTGANTTGVSSPARFARCTTAGVTILCKRAD